MDASQLRIVPLWRYLVLVLLLLGFSLSTLPLGAQDKGKVKKAEEEDPEPVKKAPSANEGSKKKSGGVEIEEAASPPPKRKVIDVGDDATPSKPAPGTGKKPVLDQAPPDLASAARQTKHPELLAYYTSLATPHDQIVMASKAGQPYNAIPLKRYYPGENPQFRGNVLEFAYFNDDWRRQGSREVRSQQVLRIVPYEELVMEQSDAFLARRFDRLPLTHRSYLARTAQFHAVVLVMAAAEAWHLSALETQKREDDRWETVRRRLHDKLLSIRIEQLGLFVESNDWESAADLAERLSEAYADSQERERIAGQLVRIIVAGLQSGEAGGEDRFKVARTRLRQVDRFFPGAASAANVEGTMRRQAQLLFDEAEKLRKDGKSELALQRMRLADEIWPRLPGLKDQLLQLDNAYPILRVGVRELPTNFLPGLATTDVEKQAVELLFEGLVRLREDATGITRYEPALAASLPSLAPLGRDFRLARGAYWSDGSPVIAPDIDATLRLLGDPKWPGSNPGLYKLLAEKIDLGGDVFRLNLNLKQGYIDPLSLMTFKILPRGVQQQQTKFNTQTPVGSGAYTYAGQSSADGKQRMARFVANPNYGSREGRLGLPRIREIQFIHYSDPADSPAEALAGRNAAREGVQVVANITPAEAGLLKEKHASEVTVLGPLQTRRVYFLAINHRRRPLKNNPELRKALALAIDRETILSKVFRTGWDPKGLHRALNGPYPAKSWAVSPRVPTQLYQPDQARGLSEQASEKGGGGPPWRLTLKFPTGDPSLASAVKLLVEQARAARFELTPLAVLPHKLREDVERTHDYELAYYSHDFTSDAYWLWPLFDPEGEQPGGTNYLGYTDGQVFSQLLQATSFRDFAAVQRTIHGVHELLNGAMPLIPLWQLDVFHAHRKEVTPSAVDPLFLFADMEHWTRAAQ